MSEERYSTLRVSGEQGMQESSVPTLYMFALFAHYLSMGRRAWRDARGAVARKDGQGQELDPGCLLSSLSTLYIKFQASSYAAQQ